MKRITMENCETLEDRKFKYVFANGTVKNVKVVIIEKHIGMTCVACDDSGNTTKEEVMCFDFRRPDRLHSRAAFLVVANDIERGFFMFDKWMSVFIPDYAPLGSELSKCAFI